MILKRSQFIPCLSFHCSHRRNKAPNEKPALVLREQRTLGLLPPLDSFVLAKGAAG